MTQSTTRMSQVAGVVGGCLAALALCATAGDAADLGGAPRRPAYVEPDYQPMRMPTWTGFYLGGTLGYASGESRVDGQIGAFPLSTDGGMATLFAGYNWQLGRTVIGVEADVGLGGHGGSSFTSVGRLNMESNLNGSFRGRLGYLVSPSLMVYGTAGLAWADMDVKLVGGSASSEIFTGYQLGLGSELMLSQAVSLRMEYLYTDLGRERINTSGLLSTYDVDYHTIRAGLAIRF